MAEPRLPVGAAMSEPGPLQFSRWDGLVMIIITCAAFALGLYFVKTYL